MASLEFVIAGPLLATNRDMAIGCRLRELRSKVQLVVGHHLACRLHLQVDIAIAMDSIADSGVTTSAQIHGGPQLAVKAYSLG